MECVNEFKRKFNSSKAKCRAKRATNKILHNFFSCCLSFSSFSIQQLYHQSLIQFLSFNLHKKISSHQHNVSTFPLYVYVSLCLSMYVKIILAKNLLEMSVRPFNLEKQNLHHAEYFHMQWHLDVSHLPLRCIFSCDAHQTFASNQKFQFTLCRQI